EGRRQVGEELVDTLVELHAVDWRAAGLEGRSGGYLERQLRRWAGQWELTRPRTRQLPGLDEVTRWLEANLPSEADSPAATVVHGDYKLDNVMFAAERPQLLAIFDWEMATIGDPLADLGWLLSVWGGEGNTQPPEGFQAEALPPPVTALPGFLSAAEIAALYEAKSGRSMRNFRFYRVMAVYKMAIILEGLYMHYVESTAANPGAKEFEWRVPNLVDRMHQLMRDARV
ncbi:MAG: phosphotransferase family protein, partial [Dehalococcoidia bacterium]